MLIPLAPETAKSDLTAKETGSPAPAAAEGAEEFVLELHPPLPKAEDDQTGEVRLTTGPEAPENAAQADASDTRPQAEGLPPPELALGEGPALQDRAATPPGPATTDLPGTGTAAQRSEGAKPNTLTRAGTDSPRPDTGPVAAALASSSDRGSAPAAQQTTAKADPGPPHSTATPQQEAAMQLSRPTRLRSLPVAQARLVPGSATAAPQPDTPVAGEGAIRAINALRGETADHPNRPPTDPRFAKQQGAPAPQSAADPAAPTAARPATADRPGNTGSTGMPATAPDPLRPVVTHPVASYDMHPARASSPPPIPQILAAYAPMVSGQPPAATVRAVASVPAEEPEVDLIAGRNTEVSPPAPQARSTGPAQTPFVTAEHLATQLAQIAQNAALHRREIQLNPQELGRIRMNLNAQDTAVHVAILVERPETLDLMRRFIGQLTDEFQALGYQDVSFDFAQHRQEGEPTEAPDDHPAATSTPDDGPVDQAPPPPPQRATPTGLLDLRI